MRGYIPAVQLRLETIRLEQSGRVLTATVDAPPFNYMNSAMQKDFIRLVRTVGKDETVGAVVVTGASTDRYITHFDMGDLSAVAERAPLMSRPVAAALLGVARAVTGRPGERLLARSPISGILAITQFHQMVLEILRSPAIWIAAVNGPCAGGGLELSVYFDVRLAAAETATFQLPELSVGLTTTVGAQRLTHLLGPAQALELLLEARAFSADQARDLGLISRVVPAEILVKEAQALASRYAARPRRAVAAQKQIINQAYHVSARKSLIAEALAQVTGVPTPTTRAALREWVGRQRSDGASVFETDPEPWVEGTAVPMNPPRNAD